jgi:ArsR family transcriptional regulator, arsenate/arsenite/antimonite-responsive transcriptional repressor
MDPMKLALSRARAARAETAQLFHALSDETRLALLDMLRGGERCVCDLQDALDAAQSRLSFHLRVLKDAKLVTDRKEGRWSYYSLNADRFAEASTVLAELAESASTQPALELHALSRASHGGSVRTARARATASASSTSCCD